MPTLTAKNALEYLQDLKNGEGDMRLFGRIRTREKCPICQQPYSLIADGEKDIICLQDRTRPKHYHLKIYQGSKESRITKDRDGHWLDSHNRAKGLLEEIRRKVEERRFRFEDYLPKELEQYRGHKLLEKWYSFKQSMDLSVTYKQDLRRFIDQYYKPFFIERDMQELKTYDIELFYKSLPIKLHPKTKKNIMTCLATFCKWLVDMEILGRKPVFPKIKPPEPPILWITKEEQLMILNYIPERHKPVFTFLIYHPLRESEAFGLKRKDFSIKKEIVEGKWVEYWVIHICRSLDRKRNEKPRKNKRAYYLPVSEHFNLDILNDKLPEVYIFNTFTGKTYTTSIVYKIWKRARIKAGLPPICVKNSTRHSIASQAVNAGIGIATISKALDHSSIAMTQKYASVEVQRLRSVIDGEIVPIKKETKSV